MRTWVEQIASLAGDDHLWNAGFQFGDWLDPAAPPDRPADTRTDPYLIATAYHAYTARLLARTAEVLGLAAAAEHHALADAITTAFNREYVTPSGRMASDSQTAYALALAFDLIPDADRRRRAAERLAQLVALRRLPHRDRICRHPPRVRRTRKPRIPRRGVPLAHTGRMPIVALSGHDGSDDHLGAVGQHAARTGPSTPVR